MSAQETKIELVAEAIEALVLATVIAVAPARNPDEHRANHRNLMDARDNVRGALKELVTPTLRVVSNPLPAKFHVVKNPPVETAQFPGGIDDMNLG